MPARLAAAVQVSALLRRIEAQGGTGAVLAKGDATAGTLLILVADRGTPRALLERTLGMDGYSWNSVGPGEAAARDDYLARRRRADPDLWIVEVDHADGAAIARETLA